jgi:tRNA 2-thiouridine synthesizing protein B
MKLHQINQSNTQLLAQVLRFASSDDIILFYEDGVYLLTQTNTLPSLSISLFALKEDVHARGLSQSILPDVTLIDYDDWVSLSETHDSIPWH